MKRAHGFQEQRSSHSSKSHRTTSHEHQNGDVVAASSRQQATGAHHSGSYSLHHSRSGMLAAEYQAAQPAPPPRGTSSMSRPLQEATVEHEALVGRATVRLPSAAHLAAASHHPIQQHHHATNGRPTSIPQQGLKRGLSNNDEEDHHGHHANGDLNGAKRMMSVEEHGNAVRPPLTRGESLPAVSLAQPFTIAERTFKQEKHPIRTPSFDTATAFKPNGYTTTVSVASGTGANSHSPLSTRTGSPPESNAASATQQTQPAQGSGQSPMAALMSVADNLPPGSPRSTGGSPPSNTVPRSASRGSQHSPNSTASSSGRRSSGSRHVSSTTVTSSEPGAGTLGPGEVIPAGNESVAPTAPPAASLKCTLCQERLEDTHFVQCPSVPHHKFCFPCSRDSIKRQGAGSESNFYKSNTQNADDSNFVLSKLSIEIKVTFFSSVPRSLTTKRSFDEEKVHIVKETTTTASNCCPLVDDRYLTYIREQNKHIKKLCKLVGQAEQILQCVCHKLKDKEVDNTIIESPKQIIAPPSSPEIKPILVECSAETEQTPMENVGVQITPEEQDIIIQELKSVLSNISYIDQLKKETNTEEEYIKEVVPKKRKGKLHNKLEVQVMPSIDIRRGLVTQKIPDVIITPSESFPEPMVPENANIAYEIVEHRNNSTSDIGLKFSERKLIEQSQPIKSIVDNILKDVNQKVKDTASPENLHSYCSYKSINSRNSGSRHSLKSPEITPDLSSIEDLKERFSIGPSTSVTNSSELYKETKFSLNREEIENNPDLKAFLVSFQVLQDSHKLDNKVDKRTLFNIDLNAYKTYINPEGLKRTSICTNTKNGSSLQEHSNKPVQGEDSEISNTVCKFHKMQIQIPTVSGKKMGIQTEIPSTVDLSWKHSVNTESIMNPELNEPINDSELIVGESVSVTDSLSVLNERKTTSSKNILSKSEDVKNSTESPLDLLKQISNCELIEESAPLKSIYSTSLEENDGRSVFTNTFSRQSLTIDCNIAELLELPNATSDHTHSVNKRMAEPPKSISNNSFIEKKEEVVEENDIQKVPIEEEYVLGRDVGTQVSNISQETIDTVPLKNGKDKKVTFCCLRREINKENDRSVNDKYENFEYERKRDQNNVSQKFRYLNNSLRSPRRVCFKKTDRQKAFNIFRADSTPRSLRKVLTFQKYSDCDAIDRKSSQFESRTEIKNDNDETTSNNVERSSVVKDQFPFRNVFPDNGNYEGVSKRIGRVDLVTGQFNSGDYIKHVKNLNKKLTRYVDNSETTSSEGSRDHGEVISEGEIRCKCDASIGEIHTCHCRSNEIRSKTEYLKEHPRTLFKREFRDRNVEIKGQKICNSNWISYYVSGSYSSDKTSNSDQSNSSSESSGIVKK